MMNLNMPNPNNALKAKRNCEHYSFCEKLAITTDDCMTGANINRRCSQGEYANIILLSKILKSQRHYKQE